MCPSDKLHSSYFAMSKQRKRIANILLSYVDIIIQLLQSILQYTECSVPIRVRWY